MRHARSVSRRFLALVTVLLAGLTVARPAAGIQLQRSVLGSAGGSPAGGSLRLGFTLGQAVTGRSQSPQWVEVAGFWHAVPPAVVATPALPLTLPTAFALERGAPSPFSSRTTLRYAIPSGHGATPVSIRVFDVAGRVVREVESGPREPGLHTAVWDGRDAGGRSLGNGVYFCLMQAGSFRAVRRLVLVR